MVLLLNFFGNVNFVYLIFFKLFIFLYGNDFNLFSWCFFFMNFGINLFIFLIIKDCFFVLINESVIL